MKKGRNYTERTGRKRNMNVVVVGDGMEEKSLRRARESDREITGERKETITGKLPSKERKEGKHE